MLSTPLLECPLGTERSGYRKSELQVPCLEGAGHLTAGRFMVGCLAFEKGGIGRRGQHHPPVTAATDVKPRDIESVHEASRFGAINAHDDEVVAVELVG